MTGVSLSVMAAFVHAADKLYGTRMSEADGANELVRLLSEAERVYRALPPCPRPADIDDPDDPCDDDHLRSLAGEPGGGPPPEYHL
jgi:hypothetical protein